VAEPAHLREWQRIPRRDRDAFTGLLRVHRDLVPRLDADLERAFGISLSSYDLLVKLATPRRRVAVRGSWRRLRS
jgi:hypothetical protein